MDAVMDGVIHCRQQTCDAMPHLAVSEELLLQADVAHPADEALHLQSAPSTRGQIWSDSTRPPCKHSIVAHVTPNNLKHEVHRLSGRVARVDDRWLASAVGATQAIKSGKNWRMHRESTHLRVV